MSTLRVLKKSRRKPVEGDIFRMKLHDDTYVFGRVVGADLNLDRAPMPESYLLYIYDVGNQTGVPPVSQMTPDRLLIAPVFTNRLGWSYGVFETIGQEPLDANDLLDRPTFWSASRGTYVDELGQPVDSPNEPCGDWALMSYEWIGNRLAEVVALHRGRDR